MKISVGSIVHLHLRNLAMKYSAYITLMFILARRGVASHFLNPMLSLVGARIGTFFRSHLPPPGEGLGVGWLRSWIKGLGLSGTVVRRS